MTKNTNKSTDIQPELKKTITFKPNGDNKYTPFNPAGKPVTTDPIDLNKMEFVYDENSAEAYALKVRSDVKDPEQLDHYRQIAYDYNKQAGDKQQRKAAFQSLQSTRENTNSATGAVKRDSVYQKPRYPSASEVATNANGSIYGKNVSLVYPNDLIGPQGGSPFYNNSYTVFFISEHKNNRFAKKQSNQAQGAFKVYNKKGWAQESNDNNANPDASAPIMKGLIAASGGYTVSKMYSNTVGPFLQGVATSVAGEGIGSIVGTMNNVASVTVGGAAALGLATNPYLNSNNLSYVQLKTCIVLPTPSIEQSNKVQWKTEDGLINTTASVISKMYDDYNGKNVSGNLTNPSTETDVASQAVGEARAFENVLKQSSDAAAMAVLAGDQTFGGWIGRRSGYAPNPRKEQMFDDVDFRSFSFEYKLFARSKKEFDTIEQIIKTFRYHALPDVVPSTFLYVYPAQFDIVHYYGNSINPHMPKHTTAVLTDINVTYGSQGAVSFQENGEPTLITLTLQFTEIAIVTKRDVLEGGY